MTIVTDYKPRWTVNQGPRVHEIAKFVGSLSKYVKEDLSMYHGYTPRSASSRVPVGVALDYCRKYNPRCSFWRDDDVTS